MRNIFEEKDLHKLFQALAVKSRLQIMRLLSEHTLCVGALSKRLCLSVGAISQHLNVLKKAGLVKSVRCGYYISYCAAPNALS